MRKSQVQVDAAEEKIESMEESFKPLKDEIDWNDPWWIELMLNFKSNTVPGKEEGLIAKVKNELSTQTHTCTFMGNRYVCLSLKPGHCEESYSIH